MIQNALGYLCVSLTEAECDRLNLHPQVAVNTTARADALHGVDRSAPEARSDHGGIGEGAGEVHPDGDRSALRTRRTS